MARRSSLPFLLVLVHLAPTTTGRSQDEGHHVQPAPSADASENQLAWQPAFWALVAVALNTVTQPSGRICGFPPGWGLYLKWSPVFCVINMVEALACIRLRRDSEWGLYVVPQKYDDDPDDAPGGLAGLQRNSLLRIVVFILGPLLQATKIYACRGIFWAQVLATVYLGSFLCDEMILFLLWTTRSIEDRDGITGLAEAVLGPIPPFRIHFALLRAQVAAKDETHESRADWRQGLAMFASHLLLVWFAVTAFTGAYIRHFEVFMAIMVAIAMSGGVAAGICHGMRFYRMKRTKIRILFEAAFAFCNVTCLVGFAVFAAEKCSSMAVIQENFVIDFNGVGSHKNWAWKIGMVLWVLNLFYSARMLLTTSDRYGIPRPASVILPLWATAHLVVAFVMFNFAHDPSETYKPVWTEVLG